MSCANNLFDNQLPFTMQADHAKHLFQLDPNDQLVLENSPVPPTSKPASARATNLASIVPGNEKPATPLLTRTFDWLRINHRLGLFQRQGIVPVLCFNTASTPLSGYFSP